MTASTELSDQASCTHQPWGPGGPDHGAAGRLQDPNREADPASGEVVPAPALRKRRKHARSPGSVSRPRLTEGHQPKEHSEVIVDRLRDLARNIPARNHFWPKHWSKKILDTWWVEVEQAQFFSPSQARAYECPAWTSLSLTELAIEPASDLGPFGLYNYSYLFFLKCLAITIRFRHWRLVRA